jgi:hypothetical protein
VPASRQLTVPMTGHNFPIGSIGEAFAIGSSSTPYDYCSGE